MSEFRDKIYIIGDNPELSAIIQKELFEQGYCWPGSGDQILPDAQGIYCYGDGSLNHGMPDNMEATNRYKKHEIINLSGWRRWKHAAIEEPPPGHRLVLSGDSGFGIANIRDRVNKNDVWLSPDNNPNPDHLLIGCKKPDHPNLKIIQRLMDAINSNHKQIERLEDEIEADKTPHQKAIDNIREVNGE